MSSRAISGPNMRLITFLPARIIAIGDVHGCSRALAALVGAIAPTPEDLLVVLGDYIDRGPDSRGVIETQRDPSGRALEPFGQVESKISRQHEGTGLGLPLAKQLAELHGGTLTIDSEVDAGTTVTILLPEERIVARQPGRPPRSACYSSSPRRGGAADRPAQRRHRSPGSPVTEPPRRRDHRAGAPA